MTVHTLAENCVRTHWSNGRTEVDKYVHLLGWATVVVRVKPRNYERSHGICMIYHKDNTYTYTHTQARVPKLPHLHWLLLTQNELRQQ
jgi:hypothetical protein